MKWTLVCLLVCTSACKSQKPAAQKDPWGGTASTESAPTTPSGSEKSGEKKWFDAEAPVGVWIGLEERMSFSTMYDGSVNYNVTKFVLATYVVWPDGHVARDAPWSGLADFDRAAWERDVGSKASLGGSPGTYERDGDGWKVTANGSTMAMSYANDELTIKKAKYKRAADVTGAKLDGVYTWWWTPEDPSLAGPGCRQLVIFKSDGTFDNRGGFALTCPAGASDDGRPGTGTYEIRDYSLILHYADGRTKYQLILAPQNGDLRTDNSHMILTGQIWQRRTGPIADAAQAAAGATDGTPTAPTPTAPPTVTTSGTTTTFDGLSFATPDGTMDQTKSSVSFTAKQGDSFCMTAVFSGVVSTGNPQSDFAAEWKDVMLYQRTADETPDPQQGQTTSGLVFNAAGSMTTDTANNARVYRALFVIQVGNRRMSVMFIAPTQGELSGCKLEQFLKTVRGA